jgi:hypothetical protein
MFAWLTAAISLIARKAKEPSQPCRSSSYFDRDQRDEAENERLLPNDVEGEEFDHDGCFPPHPHHDLCPANPYSHLPVYTTIHRYDPLLRFVDCAWVTDLEIHLGYGEMSLLQ